MAHPDASATDHVSNTGAWAQTIVITTLKRKYYYLAGPPVAGGTQIATHDRGVVYWLHGRQTVQDAFV